MPITESAIKAMRQSRARRARRQPYMTRMKSLVRSLRDAVKAGKKDEAEKLLPAVQKAIDTAAKKHLMHWRTAARKKSAAAKLLA